MIDEDPIVEEARRAGQAYVDSFKGDWKALIADLRRRSEAEGRKVVSYPPRRPPERPAPSKKVSTSRSSTSRRPVAARIPFRDTAGRSRSRFNHARITCPDASTMLNNVSVS